MTDVTDQATDQVSTESPDDLIGSPAKGAPRNNSNAFKHGLRSNKINPGTEYIGRKVLAFRRLAEAEVLNVRGKVGVWEQSLVQSASQWLLTALKIERFLRIHDESITLDQRINYLERAARALDQRDRCLTRLGLDKQSDAHTTLYASLPSIPDDDGQDGEHDAP